MHVARGFNDRRRRFSTFTVFGDDRTAVRRGITDFRNESRAYINMYDRSALICPVSATNYMRDIAHIDVRPLSYHLF